MQRSTIVRVVPSSANPADTLLRGGLAERPKAHDWKSCWVNSPHGFESRILRSPKRRVPTGARRFRRSAPVRPLPRPCSPRHGVARTARRSVEDHPRPRGEDYRAPHRARVMMGPPPRTRGRLHGFRSGGGPGGTTPAHAGKTPTTRSVLRLTADHPRARGEDRHRRRPRVRLHGPPPRTRGRPGSTPCTTAEPRTTPAHAGKTFDRDLMAGIKRGPPPRTRGRRLLTCGDASRGALSHSLVVREV